MRELLAREAGRRHVRHFTAAMLGDNLPAHRLMRRLSAHLDRLDRGSGAGELVARPAA